MIIRQQYFVIDISFQRLRSDVYFKHETDDMTTVSLILFYKPREYLWFSLKFCFRILRGA